MVKETVTPNAHEPTQALRERVSALSEAGLGQRWIAVDLGIARNTLIKHYGRELTLGNVRVQAMLGQSLVRHAVGAPAVFDANNNLIRAEVSANMTALIFACKARLGFRDRSPVGDGDVDDSSGTPEAGNEYGTAGLSRTELIERLTGILSSIPRSRARGGPPRDRKRRLGADTAKPTGSSVKKSG